MDDPIHAEIIANLIDARAARRPSDGLRRPSISPARTARKPIPPARGARDIVSLIACPGDEEHVMAIHGTCETCGARDRATAA